ncbi:MAG: chorismate synthase [Clostridia bacterium]|jgi:chorismate synthase|nr:chorismate synthase [Clostridia bacterium]
MSGIWGNKIRYSIFGESHGPGIGIVIDGLPAGIKLDIDMISKEMKRRRPGKSGISTSRTEEDAFEIKSGFFNGYTTGAPLCAFIPNTNQRSRDYEQQRDLLRPGHADYSGYIKSNGYNDYRGGGHFSGRLTAPIVFAGAVAKQLLAVQGIFIASHIYKVGREVDKSFMEIEIDDALARTLAYSDFPTVEPTAEASMKKAIADAKASGDSVGGIIEAAVLNLPAGIGAPFFDSLESTITHLIFSIPGVKGIEFGDGFDIAEMRGSEANDTYYVNNNKVKTESNHNGGILGGISNGMPIIFRAAFKPTSSIAKKQDTVNIKAMENTTIEVTGRHDPCIVPRAVPVVEAAAAMAILEHL